KQWSFLGFLDSGAILPNFCRTRVRPILVSQNWTFVPTVLDQIVVGQLQNVRPILVKLDVHPNYSVVVRSVLNERPRSFVIIYGTLVQVVFKQCINERSSVT
ncbi:hypothetical protein VIGAN_06000300, partial [Vigna angularis var. angularis]